MISINASGFAVGFDQNNLKNLTHDKGGKKEFTDKRSRRGKFYNVVSCLHFHDEIKTFWTFTVPELQTDYKNTDKFFMQKFQMLLENLILRHKRGKENGLKNYVWVCEAQSRGNIHFHLVTSTKFLDVKYVNEYWCRLIGQHSKNAVDVEFIQKKYVDKETGEVVDNSIRNVSAYFAKYMSKGHTAKDKEDLKGRIIYCKSFGYSRNFPIYEKAVVTPETAKKLFPNIFENPIIKKINEIEVSYYFVDSKKAFEFLKGENIEGL